MDSAVAALATGGSCGAVSTSLRPLVGTTRFAERYLRTRPVIGRTFAGKVPVGKKVHPWEQGRRPLPGAWIARGTVTRRHLIAGEQARKISSENSFSPAARRLEVSSKFVTATGQAAGAASGSIASTASTGSG